MSNIDDLEKKVADIEQRNKRVEKDKEWEISYIRRGLLIVFTYLAIGFYLNTIEVQDPWLIAIVPSFAFPLSTLTLPFFKRLWEKYLHKK